MDFKKNSVNYCFHLIKIVKNTSLISIGFKCPTNISAIELVKCKCTDVYHNIKYEDIDVAATCMALYRFMYYRISKDAVAEIKSKINILGCGYNNGIFYINVSVPSQLGPIKKGISLILQSFSYVGKLYKLYHSNVVSIGCKPDKEAFQYWANSFIDEMKKSVYVNAVVPDKFEKKLEEIADLTYARLDLSKDKDSSGKKRTGAIECKLSINMVEHITIKAAGLSLGIVKKFIESYINNPLIVDGSHILLPKKYQSVITKLKNKELLKKFVGSKYSKFKDELIPIMIYMAIFDLYDDPYTVSQYKSMDLSVISNLL